MKDYPSGTIKFPVHFLIPRHIPGDLPIPVFAVRTAHDSFLQLRPVLPMEKFGITENANPVFRNDNIRSAAQSPPVLPVSIPFVPESLAQD